MSDPRSEAEQKIKALEFIAPILEAQMKFDQALTNQVIADGWREAAMWAIRFDILFQAVEKYNDSMKVAQVLDRLWQPDIERRIDHYKHMAGDEPEEAY